MSVALDEVTIRPEAAVDFGAIRALLEHAFETPAEATLVDCLRRDDDLVLALVAADKGAIVGHVAFARLRVQVPGAGVPAVGLAPLAVAETHRGRGLGAALVQAGLDRLLACHETLVFVVGDPAYYSRFGFSAEAGREYACVYAGPYFMALRLMDGAPRTGAVRYPAAFDDLD